MLLLSFIYTDCPLATDVALLKVM